MQDGLLLGVIVFGLLHGINPSHGWTVALLYSMHSRKPMLRSFVSSGILAKDYWDDIGNYGSWFCNWNILITIFNSQNYHPFDSLD